MVKKVLQKVKKKLEEKVGRESVQPNRIKKVFQIGFNKCGTRTIHEFFNSNGIKSAHWKHELEGGGKKILANAIRSNHKKGKPLLKGIAKYKVYTDMERFPDNYAHIDYYKLLDEQYPNSKFILNIRDVDKWLVSRCKHPKRDPGKYLNRTKEYLGMTDEEVVEYWRKQWFSHIEDVKEYFKDRPEDLLIFDIEKDNVSKFVEFFKKDFKLNPDLWEHKGKTPQRV